MIDASLWRCGNTATHHTPDSRGLPIVSFPSSSPLIALTPGWSITINQQQTKWMFTTDNRQQQLQLPTPPLASSLNLFKRSNNCKLQLLIMANESGLRLGVYVNVYVLKTQIKHHFALSLNRYRGLNQLLPVTSDSLRFKRLSCKLLSPSFASWWMHLLFLTWYFTLLSESRMCK
jgi:hypothetical protein